MTLTLLFSREWTKTSTKSNLLARGRHLAKAHPAGLALQVEDEAGFCGWPFASMRLLQPGEQFLEFIISLLWVRELVFALPRWSAIKIQYALGENWALNIPKSLFFNKIVFQRSKKKELFLSMNDQINTFTCTRYKAFFALVTIYFLRKGWFYI